MAPLALQGLNPAPGALGGVSTRSLGRVEAFSLRIAHMIITRSSLVPAVAALLAVVAPLSAQSGTGSRPPAPNPVNTFDPTGAPDTSLFAPLNLPVGNEYRTGGGAPGPKYWQQRADYDLHGTLDTATKSLRGEMTLRYTNNSPDTLRFVWFQDRKSTRL